MCYDDAAHPPPPPGASGQASTENLVLTASDSNRFAAYAAHPVHPARAQIIILPDAGGLRQFYKELTLRFAQVGIEALAFDYFGRSAGLAARDDSFEWQQHVPHLKLEMFFADLTAALACLRATGTGERATFAIGFCMGGTFSFWSGTTDIGLSGAIGFYPHVDNQLLSEVVEQIKVPVLGLFGEADQFVPVSEVRVFDEKLDDFNIEHQVVIYPGVPHGFFELQQTAEYADDGWKRVLDFITTHTPAN
ncbi:MAG TPA: dienelactone hydrolase family protein [Ktedonosporobacter sp.]|nr:dienelactone hydrolase family protein [Ktedonosporobacter sp.]